MTAKDVLKLAKEKGAKIIDLRFIDLPGLWQPFSIPLSELNESIFEDGLGFDASSLRGWASINESDMLMIPDPTRFWVDPFFEEPTLCLFANIVDPLTKEGYGLDPRSVARRADAYLNFTGIAVASFFGPEAVFFIFDKASYHNRPESSGYDLDSGEGHWNS